MKTHNLLTMLRDQGIFLPSDCGGQAACGKCRVRIPESLRSSVSPLTETEQTLLSEAELKQGVRLACKTYINREILVLPKGGIAEALGFYPDEIGGESDSAIKNDFQGRHMSVTNNAIEGKEHMQILTDSSLTRTDSPAKTTGLATTAISACSFEDTDTDTDPVYGAAIDIGTTTLAGYLYEMHAGKLLATASDLNPQIPFGTDVISRIAYCREESADAHADSSTVSADSSNNTSRTYAVSSANSGSDTSEYIDTKLTHLTQLQTLILEKLDDLLAEMTGHAGISPMDLQKIVLVGNTVMEHILLGISPESLGKAPFTPLVKDLLVLSRNELPLNLSSEAKIHVFPAADGFIGGDHISVLLSTDLKQYSGNTLVVDIGTNTEITLCADGKLYSTSCATGPALEGACISQGMRASDGAIDHVKIDPVTLAPKIHVIGNSKNQPGNQLGTGPNWFPKGICGSGILDTVAELAACGAIGPEGTFSGRFSSDRIITDEKGEKAFILWQKSDEEIQNDDHPLDYLNKNKHESNSQTEGQIKQICITQEDIRSVQMAKAALHAGIRILQKHSGISSVDRIILAGGFGYFLNRVTALKLGLFPDCDPDIIFPVGNAAGAGAVLALLGEDALETSKQIASEIHFCESANDPDFQKFYGDAMMIPHRTETFYLGKSHDWTCPGIHTGNLPEEVFNQDFSVLSNGEKVAQLVLTVKEARQEAHCTLPLIQNLESCVYGAAMEKKTTLRAHRGQTPTGNGTETAHRGVSPTGSPTVSGYWAQGKYSFESFDEIAESLETKGFDLLQDGRIQALLDAIGRLKSAGEIVVLEASAPFTVLTALLDPGKIYAMIRKNPEKVRDLLLKLADAEVRFLEKAFKQGCTIVSLADPLGTVVLSGEKNYKELLAPSVLYILKKMRRHTKKGLIHLCGRMASDLIKSGFAVSFPLRVETKETYADMLQSAAEDPKIRMIGPGCIHSARPAAPILQMLELVAGI